MVVFVKKLIWDEKNIAHIARHHVTPEDIKDVATGFHITKVAHKNRIIIVGKTQDGRILEIVLQLKGRGRYYPITAYDAETETVVEYNRREEKQNEKEKSQIS